MKKLISIALIGICGVILASCGSSFEDSVSTSEKESESKVESSTTIADKKAIFDSFDEQSLWQYNFMKNKNDEDLKNQESTTEIENQLKKNENTAQDISKRIDKENGKEKFTELNEIINKRLTSMLKFSKNETDSFYDSELFDRQTKLYSYLQAYKLDGYVSTYSKQLSDQIAKNSVNTNNETTSSTVDSSPVSDELPNQSGIDMFNEHANGMYEESSYAIESIGPKDGTRWDVLDIVVHDDIKNMTTSEKQAFVNLWASKVQGIGQSLLFDGDVNKKPSIEVHYKNGTMLAASGLDKDRFKLYDK